MNKSEQEKFQQLQNQINHERQCADLLADAIIHGGMTRQFEALLMHETLRNGMQYPGVTLKTAVRRKRSPNHPMHWRFQPKPNPEED
jgi:hypothetical protein